MRRGLAVGGGVDLHGVGAVGADHRRRHVELEHVEVADVVALVRPAVVGDAVDGHPDGPAVRVRAAVAPVGQRVVAGAAVEHVGRRRLAGVAGQRVVAIAALEDVAAGSADQLVAVGAAAQDVAPAFGAQHVRAGAAVERQPRVAVDRLQLVGARSAEHLDAGLPWTMWSITARSLPSPRSARMRAGKLALDRVLRVELGAAVGGERVRRGV